MSEERDILDRISADVTNLVLEFNVTPDLIEEWVQDALNTAEGLRDEQAWREESK